MAAATTELVSLELDVEGKAEVAADVVADVVVVFCVSVSTGM